MLAQDFLLSCLGRVGDAVVKKEEPKARGRFSGELPGGCETSRGVTSRYHFLFLAVRIAGGL